MLNSHKSSVIHLFKLVFLERILSARRARNRLLCKGNNDNMNMQYDQLWAGFSSFDALLYTTQLDYVHKNNNRMLTVCHGCPTEPIKPHSELRFDRNHLTSSRLERRPHGSPKVDNCGTMTFCVVVITRPTANLAVTT